jgi:two-component system sensor histidine kinase KdpD
VGARPIGVLAASGRPVEPGTLDTLAGVVAIAIERAQLLEERKAGELARQGEQMKTALLASLGHDLRTPLTAIRVAAGNLKAGVLPREDAIEQSDLILSEAERLTRLFHNLLEMARIDAGAVATEARWTHPSEIVATARDQVEQTLQQHDVEVDIDPDLPVRLDPRLTATALAHLLENAAQYAPPASKVTISSRVEDGNLVVQVRDHGPGIAPADLPHLFNRFYRGAAATARTSGTGMGLWIARGLLAAEQGRVWAENCPDGGARFTIVIPVTVKEPASADSVT